MAVSAFTAAPDSGLRTIPRTVRRSPSPSRRPSCLRRASIRPCYRRLRTRLLILWFALAFVAWNGVYDMRMHDTVRGYLLETTRAEAGLGRGVGMRDYLRRGRVDAIAFSSACALGVFLAGLATMRSLGADRAQP